MTENDPRIPSLDDLPAAPRRIILHWTGGVHEANATDLAAYHYVVQADGLVRAGVPVARNMRQLRGLPMSEYAAHTRGMNSYSVGVALAGMSGAREGGPFGAWPITEAQTGAACQWVARLCEAWDLEVSPETVFHHAEAETLHGVRQAGKWDITVFPWDPSVPPHETGPQLREWVREALTYREPLDLPGPGLREIGPPEVEGMDLPDSLKDPAHPLHPGHVRRALEAEGFTRPEIRRIASALEPAWREAALAFPWLSLVRRGVELGADVWRALRG